MIAKAVHIKNHTHDVGTVLAEANLAQQAIVNRHRFLGNER